MTNPTFTVFYSWQSDRPNPVNRGFIQDALERAAKAIKKDDSILVEPVIDRDVQGIPGSPDIALAVFDKITKAQVFVADVTITHDTVEHGRRGPNPNVLVELGYGIKALGWERVVLVMNTAFGAVELLPFDLRSHLVIPYELRESEPKPDVRKELVGKIEAKLREMLTQLQPAVTSPKDPIEDVITAISIDARDLEPQVRSYMQDLVTELDSLAPPKSPQGHPDDALVTALEATIGTVVRYGKVVDAIARFGSQAAALTLYSQFEGIVERYDVSAGGTSRADDNFDFYKFLGHELFVMLVAALMAHGRLELLARILREPLTVRKRTGDYQQNYFFEICEPVDLLTRRERRLTLPDVSLHATLLKQRHEQSDLALVAPFEGIVEADLLLWLRVELNPASRPENSFESERWIPFSAVYLRRKAPRFLAKAVGIRYAEKLLPVLGVEDLDTLRSRYGERSGRVRRYFWDRDPHFHIQMPAMLAEG